MKLYIYENHLGGLFCSERELDFDEIYCEDCGDSDTLIGCADTAETAWNLLRSYTYIEENNEDYENTGDYSLNYILNFISSNFPLNNPHYVYLLGKHKENDNYILVNFKQYGIKFGEKHAIPVKISPFEEYVQSIAYGLTGLMDGHPVNLTEIKTIKKKNKTIHIFSCLEEPDEEFPNKDWKDMASYKGESWYGYIEKGKIKLVDNQSFLKEFL